MQVGAIFNDVLHRYRLVIHGGIDGYSWTVVCSNNNQATTVLECFRGAVERYGVPSRVHADRGGENIGVVNCILMYPLRGPGRGIFYNREERA